MLADANLEWLLLARAGRCTHAWCCDGMPAEAAAVPLLDYATLVNAAIARGSVAALSFGGKLAKLGVGIVTAGPSTAIRQRDGGHAGDYQRVTGLPSASELVGIARTTAARFSLTGLAAVWALHRELQIRCSSAGEEALA